MKQRTIGVFDSGVGGLSVTNAIEKALPNDKVIFVNDVKNVPYGTKTVEQIKEFVAPILQDLVRQGSEIIVIACNTVSTNLIEDLRQIITVPLIAMEPMVKPAARQTKTGVITVCATPLTLASARYRWLKETYAQGINVIEPDCSDWTQMIESNKLDHDKIFETIDSSIKQGSDVIVLGCTHYHWIEDDIRRAANGRALVIQPEQPVIEQLKKVLEQLP